MATNDDYKHSDGHQWWLQTLTCRFTKFKCLGTETGCIHTSSNNSSSYSANRLMGRQVVSSQWLSGRQLVLAIIIIIILQLFWRPRKPGVCVLLEDSLELPNCLWQESLDACMHQVTMNRSPQHSFGVSRSVRLLMDWVTINGSPQHSLGVSWSARLLMVWKDRMHTYIR